MLRRHESTRTRESDELSPSGVIEQYAIRQIERLLDNQNFALQSRSSSSNLIGRKRNGQAARKSRAGREAGFLAGFGELDRILRAI